MTFIINLSIQNFIPFLISPLLPLGLRSIKEKGVLRPSKTPEGPSQVQKPLHVSNFLFVEKGFSLLDLPWVPKSKEGSENAETKEKQLVKKSKYSLNNISVIKQSWVCVCVCVCVCV